ncbi:MAG: excinuclease ABC subunit C [Acidobacteriaceae bacterium]
MAATPVPFAFEHRAEFLPESSDELLRGIPAAPGVFALRGADSNAEPYLTRASDLRRRLRRLLAPPELLDESGQPVPSKRLNLRARIRFIEWTRTGSEFESTLLLYRAARSAFGAEDARRRLRLHPPYMLRVTMSHRHPRVYSTNRLSKRSLHEFFGPFPSRAAAERYCDAVLDLFLLRRCYEDLQPYPEHPGCVYGEMNKCMQPCKEGNPAACTPEQYAREAERVFAFFSTRGQSLLDEVAAQREAASEAMDFETAAGLHKHWEKVRAAALLADELVRPIDQLRALVLQEAAPRDAGTDSAAGGDADVFLFEHGCIAGPERLSTLGVRAVREQTAVGSSLFAQPLMLAAVPLDEPAAAEEQAAVGLGAQVSVAALTPEERVRAVMEALSAHTQMLTDINEFCDNLSLFRRWYYRPEKQRAGEVFLPNPDGSWPIRRVLNGAARVVLGPPAPAQAVDREGAKAVKTKIIHAGREGVEREVPVLPKRSRRRKAITPGDVAE